MTPELHPLCTLFPRIVGSEFDAMVADIKANGQREEIVIFEGMVLDGGNRLRACLAAGVEPRFKNFDGGSIVAFVLSANLHRRHMTPGQQAAIVASAQDWSVAQRQGGDGSNQYCSREETGNVAGLHTVADRSAQSGASERTQRMADKVAKADPELGRQVARGEISLPRALGQVSRHIPPPESGSQLQQPPKGEGEHADAGDDFDALEELEQANREITRLRAVVDADDKAAEVVRWRGAYEVAQRRSDEHLSTIASRDKQIAFLSRQLTRCGKVVGEADTDKIAPAVERMARTAKAGA